MSERLVERAIEQRVTTCAEHWFPEAGRSPTVRLRQLSNRPRSLLYAVHVGDNDRPRVIAKVRRGMPENTGTADNTAVSPGSHRRRPRLSTSPSTVAELTALEYHGLRSIFAAFNGTDPVFSAVRPLDHLIEQDAILMEYVDVESLRQVLMEQTRLRLPRRSGRRLAPETVWHGAGEWLRRFQRAMPHHQLPARQSERQQVVEQFLAYQEFLHGRIGARAAGDVAAAGADLAADVLPERLDMAVGHGDYAPRNVFIGPDGRLVVLDPLPRWVVPRHEDLCRFLVGMRLLGLQVHSHGAAFGRAEVERRERDVIGGYHDDKPVPWTQLRCFQLLILLDRWSALLDAGSGRRARLNQASVQWASGFLRRQAGRVLELADASR